MALTFNSQGCRNAANDLNKSANVISSILNDELNSAMEKLKTVYQSDAANELYSLYDKMKREFPEMLQAVNSCSNYLENTVAPAYEKVESQTQQSIG